MSKQLKQVENLEKVDCNFNKNHEEEYFFLYNADTKTLSPLKFSEISKGNEILMVSIEAGIGVTFNESLTPEQQKFFTTASPNTAYKGHHTACLVSYGVATDSRSLNYHHTDYYDKQVINDIDDLDDNDNTKEPSNKSESQIDFSPESGYQYYIEKHGIAVGLKDGQIKVAKIKFFNRENERSVPSPEPFENVNYELNVPLEKIRKRLPAQERQEPKTNNTQDIVSQVTAVTNGLAGKLKNNSLQVQKALL